MSIFIIEDYLKLFYLSPIKYFFVSISNILLVQSLVPNTDYYFSFNSVSWYLSSLLVCYLFSFYLIEGIKSLKVKQIKYILPILWIIQILFAVIFNNLTMRVWIVYVNPFFRIIDYFIGMAVARLVLDRKKFELPKSKECFKWEIITILCFGMVYFLPKKLTVGVYYTMIISIVIYIFSLENTPIANFLGRNIFVKFASISFEFYMSHQLVLLFFSRVFHNVFIKTAISFIATYLLALLLHKYITPLKYINKLAAVHQFLMKNNKFKKSSTFNEQA